MFKITCVVDNAAGRRMGCWGEHGVAFCIEVEIKIEGEAGCGGVLFDTGQSGTVLLHNMEVLGIAPARIDALALSHAHDDHTGGLEAWLSKQPGVPLYAHPDLFRPRFSQRQGQYRSIGMSVTQDELSHQADLRLGADPVEMLPGVWTTGEITDRQEPQGRSAHHFIKIDGDWRPDPYRDDMSLVLQTRAGLVVVCGCCHAGLLNTLACVKRVFARPIVAVIGGTHLVEADAAQLDHVVASLRDVYGVPRLYPNHCTGQRAYIALFNAFGETVQPFPAGTCLTFD